MNAPRLLNVVVLGFFLGLASSSLSSCGAANKCDLSSCASGCCDQNGQCQAGTSTAACGTGAAVCRACALLQTCQLGVCGSSSLGGGGGSSTGGGGGSSTGGGGGSTTGGGGGSTTGGGGGSVTGGGGGSVTGGGGGVTGGGGGSVTGGGGGSTTFEVTVAKLGAGNGTVSSSPGGIDCGFDCSQFYPSGSLVTLSAVPAIGSTFVGWGGPCSGTSTCALFVTATSTVTATFSLSGTGGGGGSVTGGGGGSVTGGGGGSVTGGGGGSVTGGGGGSVTGGGGGSVTGGGGGSVTGGGGGSTGTVLGHYVSFDADSSHGANYLLGEKLVVPSTVTLLKFGVIVRTAGPSVIMALYTDVGGAPAALVARTAATPLVAGPLEMNPVTPVVLTPGTYWIMGEYSASASIGYTTTMTSNQVAYISHAFGTTLPNPFGTPMTYSGQSFNYYLRVQ